MRQWNEYFNIHSEEFLLKEILVKILLKESSVI